MSAVPTDIPGEAADATMQRPITRTATGVIEACVPYEEYARLPGIRISSLKEMGKSPLHYRHRAAHPRETKALALGKAAHTAVLEPDEFAGRYAVWERRTEAGAMAPRRGQYWDAFCKEHEGAEIITQEEHEGAVSIAAAVHGDPLAMRYLADGRSELSLQWEMEGARCKARADWGTRIKRERYLVELKTSASIELLRFGSAAAKFGYHMQLAWQHDGYKTITGRAPTMILIAVESYPPFDVVVYRIPQDVIDQGRDDYMRLLKQLLECERTGQWPGVGGGMEQTLSLPSYIYGDDSDISDLGLVA